MFHYPLLFLFLFFSSCALSAPRPKIFSYGHATALRSLQEGVKLQSIDFDFNCDHIGCRAQHTYEIKSKKPLRFIGQSTFPRGAQPSVQVDQKKKRILEPRSDLQPQLRYHSELQEKAEVLSFSDDLVVGQHTIRIDFYQPMTMSESPDFRLWESDYPDDYSSRLAFELWPLSQWESSSFDAPVTLTIHQPSLGFLENLMNEGQKPHCEGHFSDKGWEQLMLQVMPSEKSRQYQVKFQKRYPAYFFCNL